MTYTAIALYSQYVLVVIEYGIALFNHSYRFRDLYVLGRCTVQDYYGMTMYAWTPPSGEKTGPISEGTSPLKEKITFFFLEDIINLLIQHIDDCYAPQQRIPAMVRKPNSRLVYLHE